MTKFRFHRAGYDESMATCVPAYSMGDLHILLDRQIAESREGFVEVRPYGMIEPRNGWDTHVVTIDGCAVGWADGMPER